MPARGGHQYGIAQARKWMRFNTRARARRAPASGASNVSARGFQHTCPREAGTRQCLAVFARDRFQHTCPREAGTPAVPAILYSGGVSTHVPARGGHSTLHFLLGAIRSFNTRARARRARGTLARPATCSMFQHTCPREAGTRASLARRAWTARFQHTCPREAGTWARVSNRCRRACFNTRARARRALREDKDQALKELFQHTCPREAGTRHGRAGAQAGAVSTHVPARGGHEALHNLFWQPFCFNTRARARRAPRLCLRW